MAYSQAFQDEVTRRKRIGLIAGGLAIVWWIVSIGGIILVINMTA